MQNSTLSFHERSVSELQQWLNEGKTTSYELVSFYFEQIAKHNDRGAGLRAVLEINPDALVIARQLDKERSETGARGPLHGIPVLLKDNIDTADHMHTSAGSKLLEHSYAKADAPLAENLRKAGAIILGKANMTEWANFMTEGMPSGYSSRGGQVLNPYGPGVFDVGGSSSGSAAAVAANFVTVAVGTETSGSILSPASQNNLVGIKPTVGLISRRGVIPISSTQDTAGPIARTVQDAAYLLEALASKDEQDPVTLTQPEQPNYQDALQKDGLQGLRIGLQWEPFFSSLDEEKQQLLQRALDVCTEHGALLDKEAALQKPEKPWGADVLIYEFKTALESYLRTLDPSLGIRTIEDIMAKHHEDPNALLRYGQTLFEQTSKTSGTLTEPEYIESLLFDQRNTREEGIDKVLRERNLDLLVYPNNYGAMIPAKAGYPSITVPAGFTKAGEPVGITFTGPAYSEPLLIQAAYAFEQATHFRRAPQLSMG